MAREAILLAMAMAAVALGGCESPPAGPTGASMVIEVQAEPWHTPNGVGKQLVTPHYRIFTTTANRDVINYLPGFMEASYRNYLRLTGLPDRPGAPLMDIYMMGARAEWAELTRKQLGPLAELYLAIEAGGYCYEKIGVFWDMGNLGTFSTAAHEGLHQFLAYRLRNHLPSWLEEGLCTVAEGYDIAGRNVTFTPQRNVSRFGSLREALVQGRTYPIAKLLSMDAGDVTGQVGFKAVGYYGQLWALVQFLRAHPVYRVGLRNLLADAEAGKLHLALKLPDGALDQIGGRAHNRTVAEPLFRHYICDDLSGFEKEFREFAIRLAGL
jgi:hypothetical protein